MTWRKTSKEKILVHYWDLETIHTHTPRPFKAKLCWSNVTLEWRAVGTFLSLTITNKRTPLSSQPPGQSKCWPHLSPATKKTHINVGSQFSLVCFWSVGGSEDIIIIIHTRPAALSVKFSCLQLTTRNTHTHESSSNNNNKFRPERRAFQIESHPSSVVISLKWRQIIPQRKRKELLEYAQQKKINKKGLDGTDAIHHRKKKKK